MLQILLIRPGATELDLQGRITGTLDVPLSEAGQKQADELAIELSEFPLTAIYTGPGLASQETSARLSRDGEIKIRVEDGLRNLNYGLWHGKRVEEIKDTQPKLFRQWQDHPQSVCPPGGETLDQVTERISRVIKKIRKKHKAGVVAIIAPEPLTCVIQSIIESTDLVDNWNVYGNCGSWKTVRINLETPV